VPRDPDLIIIGIDQQSRHILTMSKMPERPSDSQMKARAISRWDNEGGALMPERAPRSRDTDQLAERISDNATGEADPAMCDPGEALDAGTSDL
jgi:hypothetical protein